jgi:short-subunit dehydrogenase
VTWVIVGASAGLGRALAERLAAQKRTLLLAASDPRDLEALGSDLRLRYAAGVETVAHDAADPDGLARRLGDALPDGGPIEGLLFPLGAMAPGDEGGLDPREAERLVRVNFLSVAAVTRRFLPALLAQRHGVIAGFGSVAAVRGRGRNVVYAASKRALESYFESLRHRHERNGLAIVFYTLGYMDTGLAFGQSLPLPKASPDALARCICRELGRRRGRLYRPRWWRLVALAVRLLPWAVYKRLSF